MRSKFDAEQRQDLLVDVMHDINRIWVIQETLEESPSRLGDLRYILLNSNRVERVVGDPSVLTPDKVK